MRASRNGHVSSLSSSCTRRGRAPCELRLARFANWTLDAIAGIIDELADRHGVEYSLSSREIARGAGALNRGLAVEQLLDPDMPSETFEEMHVAYMRGLTKKQPSSSKRGKR